jgi:hypothetical protein
VLVRQNLIVVPGAFTLLAGLDALGWRGAARPLRGMARVHLLIALALPFAGLGFQLWLWRGLLPPVYMARQGYFRFDAAIYLLALLSIAANIGYYLMPAAFADLLSRRARLDRRTIALLLLAALLGGAAAYALRGAFLVNTYGTFKHALDFVGARGGLPARLVLYLAAWSAFLWIAYRVLAALTGPGGFTLRRLWLPLLAIASWAVLAFGLARIYERHILPLYALALLNLQQAQGPEAEARLPALGWLGVALFGAAHSVLYAFTVYEL